MESENERESAHQHCKKQSSRNPELEAYFMRQALHVAKEALDIGEVPVGCVVVLHDVAAVEPCHGHIVEENSRTYDSSPSVIISHGANQVNATRDASRHAEIVAIDRMLTRGRSSDQMKLPPGVICKSAHGKLPSAYSSEKRNDNDKWVNIASCDHHWKNSFGWGSDRVYTKDILSQCDLYVTCEPCIMVRL
ncbi:hypothetical protein ACHAWF_018014 [Thalassiosira exigua]